MYYVGKERDTYPVTIIKWNSWGLDLGMILGFLLSTKSLFALGFYYVMKASRKKKELQMRTQLWSLIKLFSFSSSINASFCMFTLTKMIWSLLALAWKKSLKCRDWGDKFFWLKNLQL